MTARYTIGKGNNLSKALRSVTTSSTSKYLVPIKSEVKFTLGTKVDVSYQIKEDSITRLIKRINSTAFDIMTSDLGDALTNAIRSNVWSGNDRDIIDSGALAGSLSITKSNTGIEIRYSEPYAALIHYGGYVTPYGNESAKREYITGKPWAESVLFGGGPVEQYDYQSAYSRAISRIT